jgi:N-acetylmuramoyl-L-alanine amidase
MYAGMRRDWSGHDHGPKARLVGWVPALCFVLIGCNGADGSVTTTSSQPTTTAVSPMSTTTAPTSTTSVVRLAETTIVLDPGHNGMNWAHPEEINELVDIGNGTRACNTTGTSTDDGYAEARFNWEVAVLARSRLEALGATVLLTRTDNDGWGPCITERAAIGNRAGADAVISIHADGGPSEGRGFHVIHPAAVAGLTDDIASESLRLARALHIAYQGTGMPLADYIGTGGFSERDDLGGLNLSDVPVVFLEAGNMRNEIDATLLTDPAFQEEVAETIVTALVDFLGS